MNEPSADMCIIGFVLSFLVALILTLTVKGVGRT